MKKTSFKFTKKGLIALMITVVLLAGAIYLNVKLGEEESNMDVLGKEQPTDTAEQVNANVYSDYFVNFRNERNNIRAQEIDYLRTIISQEGTDKETLDAAQERLLELVNNMEKEFSIENKVKAKGFLDAAVLFKNGMISVIIDGESLSDEDIARIVDIVKAETGINADKIRISLNDSK